MRKDLPTGAWDAGAPDYVVQNTTVLGGIDFGADTHATFYDDGTTWVQTRRRLTVAELEAITEQAQSYEKFYERHGITDGRTRRPS